MTEQNLLKLAKKGNAKALTAILNQSLQPKSVTAKVNRQDDYLQILLESAQIPDQAAMVSFIRKGLIKLEIESIQKVKVYGRKTGEESPAWSKKFELVSPPETPSSTQPTDSENLSSYQTFRAPQKSVPPNVDTPPSTGQTDFQNPRRSSAMSTNPTPPQPMGPVSIGNVISAGLRIYREHFQLYLGLALKALLWSFVPIYGWAKNYQIQSLISRQVFKELVNEPESVSTTRTQMNNQFWSFWIAQILIFLIAFGVNIGLSTVTFIVNFISATIMESIAQDNPGLIILLGLLEVAVQLVTSAIYLWVYSRFFIAELPLAIENNMSSTSCIGRSWELTKGFVVRIQLVILVAGLITAPIILLALVPIFFMIPSLTNSYSPEALVSAIFGILFWVVILVIVGSTLMMPFWQAIKAVIYYDLRSRREGLGLQLRDSR